jgi:hypothetical protein
MQAPEGNVDGLERVHQHVPEEEQQDPGRERVEELAQGRSGRAHLAQREPDQDGHAGDKAE